MKKLTETQIKEIITKIKTYLQEKNLYHDVGIYSNSKYENSDGELYENVDVKTHLEYCNPSTISLTFEGPLYSELNDGNGEVLEDLDSIINTYGLYWDFGNSWNISAYYLEDNSDTNTSSNERIDIDFIKNIGPKELCLIQEFWKIKSDSMLDIGSCVLGAKYEFSYKDTNYTMSHLSCNQGSLSWEHYRNDIKWFLEKIGCCSIIYDYGIID